MKMLVNSIFWTRHRFISILFFALLGLSACSSYYLGSTSPSEIRSVNIPTFINETSEPQLDALTTRATIQEFQRDGALSVATANTSDVRLEVRLTRFELVPLRYKRNEEHTTQEYRMIIGAKVVCYRTRTDEALISKFVTGDADFNFVGDMGSSKMRGMPKAANDLAKEIVQLIVEYW